MVLFLQPVQDYMINCQAPLGRCWMIERSEETHCVCVCVCIDDLNLPGLCCRCSSRPPPWRCPWAWAPPCPWACSTSPRPTSSSATRSRTSRRGSAASKLWCRRLPCPRTCPRSPTIKPTGSPRSFRTDPSEGVLFSCQRPNWDGLKWTAL